MNEISHKEKMAELFNEYSSMVYRVALFLTKSTTLADDITQETFIQMIRKYHLYDRSRPLEPWIYKITINITRNTLRKQKLLSLIGMTTNISHDITVESTVLHTEWKSELWDLINNLPRKSKEIIILHFYSELTLVEVADALEIPIGTCKSRLNYALTKLRNNSKVTDWRR